MVRKKSRSPELVAYARAAAFDEIAGFRDDVLQDIENLAHAGFLANVTHAVPEPAHGNGAFCLKEAAITGRIISWR